MADAAGDGGAEGVNAPTATGDVPLVGAGVDDGRSGRHLMLLRRCGREGKDSLFSVDPFEFHDARLFEVELARSGQLNRGQAMRPRFHRHARGKRYERRR
jgi:hypothetical protein